MPLAAGRPFTADDERSPGAVERDSTDPLPVVLGYDLAVRLFGGAESALGLHDLAGRRLRVVGVAGRGVKFPDETNVWGPVPSDRDFLPAYVRLRPNATLEQLAASFPDIAFRPLRDAIRPGGERVMVALFVSAALLLIVTWVQIAALLLSGAFGRLRELGVRLALGASRLDLVRDALAQSVVIAGAALGVALLAVRPLTWFIVQRMPIELRRGQYLDPDLRVYALAGMLSLAGIVMLTLVPALVTRRVSPLAALRGRLTESSWAAGRWRRVLLVGQVSVTALVLYLSGLALHTFVRVTTVDYGFDADRVLLFRLRPHVVPDAHAQDRKPGEMTFEEYKGDISTTLESLNALDGVRAAELWGGPLNTGDGNKYPPIHIEALDGRPRNDVFARQNLIGPTFVQVLGARIAAGVDVSDREYAGQDHILLVNETLAKQLMPDVGSTGPPLWRTVVGRELRTEVGSGRIIGVVADLVQMGPAAPADPEVPFFQRVGGALRIAIRVPAGGEPAVRAMLQRTWGRLSPGQFRWMRDAVDDVFAPYRNHSVMMAALAMACLVIAGVGLFGALTYSVRSRTRQIAIHVALGADPGMVRRHVIRQALGTAAAGIVLGAAAGAATASLVEQQVLGLRAADATTLLGVAAGLILLALLAAAVPARSAARIDPAVALREASFDEG